MADFDWKDDEDAIVLGWQPRTAVYCNSIVGGRGVVIRQEADAFSEDRGDDVVYLTPLGAMQIAWRLIEAAHECGIPFPPRKLLTQPLDLGPRRSPIPLTDPEPIEAGPLLKAMERGAPANDGARLATAARPNGRQSPKAAAE